MLKGERQLELNLLDGQDTIPKECYLRFLTGRTLVRTRPSVATFVHKHPCAAYKPMTDFCGGGKSFQILHPVQVGVTKRQWNSREEKQA